MTLKEYLESKNSSSSFTATQSDVGGNITFSNSGKRGTVKEFTLGLDSFITIIKDIKSNINSFRAHKNYIEKEWRDLGSEFYSDGPANAMSTVQTKPLFTTISKIIAWANSPKLENIDTDQYMEIEDGPLENAFDKLNKLAQLYLPKEESANSTTQQENVAYKDKSIREFAKYIFTYFFGNDWHEILDSTKQNASVINGVNFISHDFDIFKRLIGEFSSLQTKESLTSSNTIRYFEEPILIESNKFYYFTTQWNGEGDYSLSFSNLKFFFEKKYPEFRIKRKDGIYYLIKLENVPNVKFVIENFLTELEFSGLSYSNKLITRFTASLLTKPFVILTGLSGSGKTKLAQAFVQWICQDESQYRIIPVGADWTNREPLLGYPNALKSEEYVKPDSGVLDLIIQANNQPDLPHFLILDEMNLSHVERYFADFLSVMESKEEIPLYAEGTVDNGVPSKLKVPSNLFIIGTVNIDETTNMFSPKVLDRANTIEFRVTQDEMKNFLSNIRDITMDALTGKGAGMAKSFLEMAASKDFATTDIAEINAALVQFFGELKKTGAEFGYRSATEILRLINQLSVLDNTLTKNQKIDVAIIQKLLPKLHGSRRKLCPVLETLGSFCIAGDVKIIKDVFENADFDFNGANVLYPLSLEKITRMYRGAIDNGFASFAEA
jgi:energy-coupling factor transporter ATP-binding protein EcfA2